MAVRTDTTFRTLKRDWTIYRVDLDDFTAKVWKQMTDTEEGIRREIRKLNKFIARNDHPTAFVYREDTVRRLEIPVL